MMNLKSRLARLFRGWAQRLDPVFKMPPIQYTINRVHRIEVSHEVINSVIPKSMIVDFLNAKLLTALKMYGAIKLTEEPGLFGTRKYTATMYAMIAGDEEGGVS